MRDSCLTALLCSLIAAGSLLGPGAARAASADATTAAYYLVLQRRPDGGIRTLHSELVDLRKPLKSASNAEIARRLTTPSRQSDAVGVVVRDAARRVVHQSVVEIPKWLRGEFDKGGSPSEGESNVDGHLLPMDSSAFVVRVPVISGATLELEPAGAKSRTTIGLDSLAAKTTRRARAVAPPPLPGWNNGDPANRVDLLILGDGYTSAQQAQFETDASTLVNNFFAITPYDEYRNYVNASSLFVASAQSGADQPPYNPGCSQYSRVQTCCGDATAAGEGSASVNTAFDGTFCSYNIERLVTVDAGKVLAAAAAEPDWDAIIVLVNDVTYGGSGGALSVVSTNGASVEVAKHEYGHTFTRLADEYESPYPGYPLCSDILALPACEPNVTDQTNRPQVKWNRWIDPGMAVPSTGMPPQPVDAGLWVGARFQSSGMYRQGYNCMMRSLGTPFGDVASEAYAMRLYQGSWGVPSAGIDNIEPGSESPAQGAVQLPSTNGGTFSAIVLGPVGGPDVSAVWSLDGLPVSSATAATGSATSYAFLQPVGTYTLTLDVTDTSPILHSSVQPSFTSSRAWTVTVTPCGDGTVDPGEGCDDGGIVAGDGCDGSCRIEACYACAGAPSSCAPITTCANGDGCCGNGCNVTNDSDCPVLITGAKLLIKDDADTSKRRIVFVSNDPLIDTSVGSGADPVADGAGLQVYNAAGGGDVSCFNLPGSAWSPGGSAPDPNYRYRDLHGLDGPCKTARLRDSKQIRVVCDARIQPIAYSLDEASQASVAVTFQSGTHKYCAVFGGTVASDSGTDPPNTGGRGMFRAKNAPAPASCPLPPSPCSP